MSSSHFLWLPRNHDALAGKVASEMGPAVGKRIVHVTDLHNRFSGLRWARVLIEALKPDVVVNTGDLSGLGSLVELVLFQRYGRHSVPFIFTPGNHDSEHIDKHVRRVGGHPLLEPSFVESSGLRFWGYRDPNRTRLLPRANYRPQLCKEYALRYWPPSAGRPVIAALHNELMAGSPTPAVPLVLCGHVHTPKVWRDGPTLFVRAGSTGGGGPFQGPLTSAVVDVDPESHQPLSVWLIKAKGSRVEVTLDYARQQPEKSADH